MAWIVLLKGKKSKFSDKIYYSYGDNEFFLRGCFFIGTSWKLYQQKYRPIIKIKVDCQRQLESGSLHVWNNLKIINAAKTCKSLHKTFANFGKLAEVCKRLQHLPCNDMLMLKQYDKKCTGGSRLNDQGWWWSDEVINWHHHVMATAAQPGVGIRYGYVVS